MDKKNEKNLKLQANQMSNDDLESVAGGGPRIERDELHGGYNVVDEAGEVIRKATIDEVMEDMLRS